jgi:hypothetical protein
MLFGDWVVGVMEEMLFQCRNGMLGGSGGGGAWQGLGVCARLRREQKQHRLKATKRSAINVGFL